MLLQVNIIRVDFAAYKYYYLKGNANGIKFLGKFVKHARINTSASQARDSWSKHSKTNPIGIWNTKIHSNNQDLFIFIIGYYPLQFS